MLQIQWYMQMAQAACFIYIYFISGVFQRLGKCFFKVTFLITLLMMIFIPVASMIHWVINYDIAFLRNDNHLKAWIATYPMMGAMNILYYFFTIDSIRKGIRDHEAKRGTEVDFVANPLNPILHEYTEDEKEGRVISMRDMMASAAFFRKNHRYDIEEELTDLEERSISENFPQIKAEELREALNLMKEAEGDAKSFKTGWV